MVDLQSPGRVSTPVVPAKRTIEDDHAPNVPSPLNPDAATRPRPARAPAREQREKKDSLKKRESVGAARGTTPEHTVKKQKFTKDVEGKVGAPSPVRYNHALPREAFHYTIREPAFASHEPEPMFAPNGIELKKPLDHAENKKGFRYSHCYADQTFNHSRYYRPGDNKPYGPRMSFEDSDKWFHFDEGGTILTNEKGWRMGRANVVAREGTYYYEVRILRGVPAEGPPVPLDSNKTNAPLPHIRMGWARREAPLDAPVGFDGYSYGMTDIRLEPMHKSRPGKFLDDGTDKLSQDKKSSKSKPSKTKQSSTGPGTLTAGSSTYPNTFSANDHARDGDVIGLEITLPSLSLHRRIVEGNYNPAVDVTSGLEQPTSTAASLSGGDESGGALNIVRDRFPVPYKGSMYFESLEYRASKAMESYGDRGPFAKDTPSPNHSDPTLRYLPHSSIRVYKNGKRVGTAFKNLMAFLPPASAPEVQKGVRAGVFDDGMLGYYPAVAAFSGGVAEVNLGPQFWCPPQGLVVGMSRQHSGVAGTLGRVAEAVGTSGQTVSDDHNDASIRESGSVAAEEDRILQGAGLGTGIRAVGERYYEQIAEEMWYDILDEVDFELQDTMEE